MKVKSEKKQQQMDKWTNGRMDKWTKDKKMKSEKTNRQIDRMTKKLQGVSHQITPKKILPFDFEIWQINSKKKFHAKKLFQLIVIKFHRTE